MPAVVVSVNDSTKNLASAASGLAAACLRRSYAQGDNALFQSTDVVGAFEWLRRPSPMTPHATPWVQWVSTNVIMASFDDPSEEPFVPSWFAIALACALFTACCDATSKRIMQENDEWITGATVLFVAGVLLTPLIVSLGLRPFTWELAELLIALLPLEVLGYYLFLSALRLAPLSLVTPLLAFTPVLTVLTAQFLLGEVVSDLSRVGIGLVGVGAYILYIDPADRSLFGPLRALFANAGARRMLLAAAVWALTSTLGKPGTQLYGAIQFGFLVLVCLTACFGVMSLIRMRRGATAASLTRKTALLFLIAGLFMAAAEVTHFLSLSMAPVACMIAVKRISLVFGVLLGRIVFGEEHVGYRFAGSSLMVAGLFFLYQ